MHYGLPTDDVKLRLVPYHYKGNGYKAFKLVGLSELGSNKYVPLFRLKERIRDDFTTFSTSSISDKPMPRKEIDEFGEVAVKSLMQPFRIEFSPEEIKSIIVAYEAGESTQKIGQQYNCSKTTISNLLKDNGVKVTKAKAQEELDIKTVIRMYGEMYTTEKIAKLFGVSPYTINRCLRESGVKIRGRWDYHDN